VLRAAGADHAKLLIVALDDVERGLRTVEAAKRNHPNLTVLARARNRHHAHLLMDRDVDGLVRDTFLSSLRLAELSLRALGVAPDAAAHAIALFREHDEANLVAVHAIYRDEAQLIQSTQQAAEELTALFEADREST
jgi:voltage-gated potassium channel Kch